MSHTCLAVVCLLVSVTAHAHGYDSAVYEDMLFQDLYKRLTRMDSMYYPLEDGSYGGPEAMYDAMIPLDSRDSGQADIRDPEFLSQSANSDGFQYISGGAGEGKQHLKPEGTQENIHEVKSDDVLPFYCHPPNPCPKGFTEEDGCQMNIPDTAERQKQWISDMQDKGLCTCDEEHMFDCDSQGEGMPGEGNPGLEGNPNANDILEALNPGYPDQKPVDVNDFLSNILGDAENYGSEYKNPYTAGERIDGRVAKKSPRMRRSVENMEYQLQGLTQKRAKNPYLQGQKIHVVAKKGMEIDQ